MIHLFKTLSDICKAKAQYIKLDNNNIARGQGKKRKKQIAPKIVRQNFFPLRATNTLNSIPQEAATAPSLDAFKGKLDKYGAAFRFSL